MTDYDMSNTVALIAGGTGGLGSLIAAELRTRGATVVTTSRTAGTDATHIIGDLRSPDDATRVVNDVIARYGRLDIVVNAAGVVAFGDVVDTSVDTIEEVFLTNTFAHMFLCSASLPKMEKSGVIVGISGVIAERNMPGMSVYGASKAAVRSFNEAFAREARRVGVRVIDARPPHTETGLATRAIAGTAPRFSQGLDPQAVARRIVRAIIDNETDLASEEFVSH